MNVLLSALMLKESRGAVAPPMPTSIKWQNCTHNETSFTELFDKPGSVNKTRWDLWALEFGWEKG